MSLGLRLHRNICMEQAFVDLVIGGWKALERNFCLRLVHCFVLSIWSSSRFEGFIPLDIVVADNRVYSPEKDSTYLLHKNCNLSHPPKARFSILMRDEDRRSNVTSSKSAAFYQYPNFLIAAGRPVFLLRVGNLDVKGVCSSRLQVFLPFSWWLPRQVLCAQ